MLGVIAKLTIKPGTNADFEATMKALQAKVRADEPGNKLYALHKTSDDNVYVMLERYDDQAALEAHRFPVFSTGLALRGATKNRPGAIDRFGVVVGDVEVEPGDWVVGDADGVVVVPGATIEEVVAAGRSRAEKEAGYFTALRGGATTLELLGLDADPIEGA
jgi:hypothetical protein